MDAFCPRHADEVHKASSNYGQALARNREIQAQYTAEAQRYVHPWAGLSNQRQIEPT
jgi:hypothetical protein